MNDEDIGRMMRDYAEHCISEAQIQHGAALDYSEQSLLTVDLILSEITHNGVLPLPEPNSREDELLCEMAKAYGGFVGEVMRLHLGAVWFCESINGAETVRMRAGSKTFSPPERVWKRLTADPHDTILSYYRALQHLLGRQLFQPTIPEKSPLNSSPVQSFRGVVQPPPLANGSGPPPLPNAIERAIITANHDRFAAKPLLQALREAEVFILTNSPQSLRDMLLVRDDSGFLGVAMFTQAFRTEPAIARHPEYEFVAQVKFMAVLSCIKDGIGFVLNPYTEEVCHRSNPEQAKFLAQHL